MQARDFDYWVPDWPVPNTVRALCTGREGGASVGRYAGLNVGLHVGDVPATVRRNRQLLEATIGVRPVFLNQVHGSKVVHLDASTHDAAIADGACTAQIGVACTVMVADCLPVLFCDATGSKVAAAHAGWRGLLGERGWGILEATLESLHPGDGMENMIAWLGPCIGPLVFEVGDEVRTAFLASTPTATLHFQPLGNGKWLADLAGLARQRLQASGVTRIFGNDSSQPWCTVSNPSRFFSHRRDGVSGRMAACIWRIG
jgi:YfiH family protein